MDNEEFRQYGHQVVDWIADYLKDIRQYPVFPDMHPGDLLDRLPPRAPDFGEPMDAILEDFQRSIVPALTHWNHPRFFAYFRNLRVGAGHPGRNAGGRAERQRDAVEELPGPHRA